MQCGCHCGHFRFSDAAVKASTFHRVGLPVLSEGGRAPRRLQSQPQPTRRHSGDPACHQAVPPPRPLLPEAPPRCPWMSAVMLLPGSKVAAAASRTSPAGRTRLVGEGSSAACSLSTPLAKVVPFQSAHNSLLITLHPYGPKLFDEMIQHSSPGCQPTPTGVWNGVHSAARHTRQVCGWREPPHAKPPTRRAAPHQLRGPLSLRAPAAGRATSRWWPAGGWGGAAVARAWGLWGLPSSGEGRGQRAWAGAREGNPPAPRGRRPAQPPPWSGGWRVPASPPRTLPTPLPGPRRW
jgi:hypothetical protein